MRRFVLASFLLACTTPRGESTSATRGAIQGGALDSGDEFAVAIVDETNGMCSGTLIAPNLVLTARHCIAGDDGGDFIDCAKDRFQAPRAPSTYRVTASTTADYDTAEYAVTKILVPSDSLFCGNDIALVILDGNATGILAEPLLDLPDLDAVTAIGFGTTAPGANDDGKRRKLANVEVACVPGIPARDCDLSSYEMAKSELAGGAGMCEGDSGSGAYVPTSIASGKPVVIGVLSRGTDDGETCLDSIYTRTDAFKQFLVDGATEASTTGGYALPGWAKPAGTTPDPAEDPTADPSSPRVKDDPDTSPAAPTPLTTTTTASGCAAAPGTRGEAWPWISLAFALVCRRRRRQATIAPRAST